MSESLDERRSKLMAMSANSDGLSNADSVAKEAMDLYKAYSKLAQSLFEQKPDGSFICKLDKDTTKKSVGETLKDMGELERSNFEATCPDMINPDSKLIKTVEAYASEIGSYNFV